MTLLKAIAFLSMVGSQATALALFYPVKSRSSLASRKNIVSVSSTSQDALDDASLAHRHQSLESITADLNQVVTEEEEASLILQGDISTQSKSLPVVCEERLCKFFQTPSFRNLLVSGGGQRPVEYLPLTETLFQDWTQKCKVLGASPPSKDDSILAVESKGIQFPGLKVKSTATVGVKYVEDPGKASPRHEFVLLGTQEEAKGLPPVVWIYNKLTGGNKRNEGSGDSSRAQSLSTVSYETNNGNVVFRTKAFLRIGISFPKVLLKILPGDKATIEEKASSSVQKTLEKDCVQSMKAYESAYSDEMKI